MKMLSSIAIYQQLKEQEALESRKGLITFQLHDVSIVVKQRDVVGNMLQEWLGGWLEARGIYFRTNPNSQMPQRQPLT